MDVIPGAVIIEPASSRQGPKSQPIEALSADTGPVLDDNAVREAIQKAVVNNQDPQTITMEDFAQGSVKNPAVPEKPATEVPQKFLKPDGAVDVDKIQASTKALDEAIANRDPIPQKTVDDYLTEYREKEKLFRSQTLPRQEPLVATPPPIPQAQTSPLEYEEIVRRDYAADPLGTTTRLFNLMLEQKFQPIAEREKIETTRTNLQELARKDPRILRGDVFAAVNAKLHNDPDLWKLKNPHKAAYLDVKEEMRLGDFDPNGSSQAQPSRNSPVLGGGTPPSAPSSSASSMPQDIISNLHKLDLRDKKQEMLGDEAIRKTLMGSRG